MEVGKFSLSAALVGYELNQMCHSLNAAAARAAFAADPAGYCQRYALSDEEIAAVIARDKPRLYALGGNMYYLAKLDRVKQG